MLRQVAQHVDDRTRATAFYRDVLRLPLLQEYDPPGLSFFDLGGGTRLLLEAPPPPCSTSASTTSRPSEPAWRAPA